MRHLAALLAIALAPTTACVCNVESGSSSTARPHDHHDEPKPNHPQAKPNQPNHPDQPDPVDPPSDPLADYKPPRLPDGVHECPAPQDPDRAGEPTRPKKWPLTNKQYVELDHGHHSEGKCLVGTCPPGPSMAKPPPSAISFDDALKMVLHDAHTWGGAAGSGGGDRQVAVLELPFTHAEVTIESVSGDGTITVNYEGVELVLAPGQRWDCESTSLDRKPEYTVERTRHTFFENRGILNKSDRKTR